MLHSSDLYSIDLDYYKFWLKSIDSLSDIHAPVIVVGTHAENKSHEVSFKINKLKLQLKTRHTLKVT